MVVEAGLFGSPGAHATLSRDDFSLRINGKKKVAERALRAGVQVLERS